MDPHAGHGGLAFHLWFSPMCEAFSVFVNQSSRAYGNKIDRINEQSDTYTFVSLCCCDFRWYEV